MSRKAGDGSRNYVIFDDKLIKILEENGMPVPQSRARGTELVTRVSGPALAWKKFISGFRSRGMVSQETYDAYRDNDAFKKASQASVSFWAKDMAKITDKLFGEGDANYRNFRVFYRDPATGEASVSFRGFDTRDKAEAFAVTNRYNDYIVSTGNNMINMALGSNEQTLKEDVRDAIEKLTKKGLDDIAKSIEAYKEEYLDYWNLVVLETQADMVDAAQIATLRDRKEQWMAALRLRSEEQKKLVDDARKEAVQAALADAKHRIVQQQKFAKAYLPDDLVHQIERGRGAIDKLSSDLRGIKWLMEGSENEMIIEGLDGIYVTRSYEAFETSDKAAYVAWLNEAYSALTNSDQVYDPLAMERIMPTVRHIKNQIIERRIEDLKKENDQRQVDAIMEDLMADSRQVTQVDRIPGQPIEGTEYEQLIRAVAKRDLLRRRSDEKKRFVRDMMRHLDAVVGFGSNIGNRRKRAVALRKEANRIYNERYGDAEQQIIADMFGRPEGLQWAVMTDDEAHDIANVERALSESPANLNGSEIWRSDLSGETHSSFYAAVNAEFKSYLDYIAKAPFSKTGANNTTTENWRRLNDKILEHKSDIPAFLRTLWGEKDNPLLRVSDTILKQSNLVAVGKLYDGIAEIGKKEGWLIEEKMQATDAKYTGWVSVLGSKDNDQGYRTNPLAGKVTDPVMAEAISKLLEANQPSNSAFKVISFVVGAALWNVTAGSVRAIVRNLASLPIFLMNSGILGAVINPTRWPIVAKNIILALRIVQQSMEATGDVSGGKQIANRGLRFFDWIWTGFLSVVAAQRPALYALRGAATIAELAGRIKEQPTKEAYQEIFLKATRLGVANDNVQKESIHRLLDMEEQAIRSPKDKNMGRFAKALKLEGAVGFGSYLFGTVKSTLQQRSQLYGAPDDFTKILAWLNEMDTQANIHAKDDAQYKEWCGEDGLFAKMPDNFVKQAADNVTNLIQSHSRVWAHITQMKRAGFGILMAPFAAARAEFYRNAVNAYIIAFKEMRSTNKKEQMNGGIRFASALMAHVAMGNAIGAVVKTIFGAFADDEEMVDGSPEIREAIRKLGPEYAKNKNATYILYKNGTFDWVDLSYANPFAFVWDSITAARRGATEAEVDDIVAFHIAKEIIDENLGTFAKPQIALDALATVRTGYDPIRGVKIWDSQADSTAEKVVKSVSYYMRQAGAPGDFKDAMKIVKAARGVEENGRQYKVGTEVGAVFLGTSIRTVNITDALEQKLAQAKDTLGTRITPLYKAPLRNANDVEMEDVALAVQQYAKAHDQAVSTMQKSYKAAETLLRETPNAKTLLRNVMSSDRVRMSQEVERAIVTGKPSFPGFSDQTLQKVKDLGKKHDDDRAKAMVDALKEYNQKKKNP
jgi:7,8-dihydro-6-hydroxymethylpterin-pyrophosphokinase